MAASKSESFTTHLTSLCRLSKCISFGLCGWCSERRSKNSQVLDEVRRNSDVFQIIGGLNVLKFESMSEVLKCF